MGDTYGEKGLKVLVFPCTDFGGKEPETLEKIVEYVEKSTDGPQKFTFFEPGLVKGEKTRPVFAYLKDALPSDNDGHKEIIYYFSKFLIDREGNPVLRKSPRVQPLEMKESIEALLEKQ